MIKIQLINDVTKQSTNLPRKTEKNFNMRRFHKIPRKKLEIRSSKIINKIKNVTCIWLKKTEFSIRKWKTKKSRKPLSN
jgi:hypothetical protein